jgi:hypothetical protein
MTRLSASFLILVIGWPVEVRPCIPIRPAWTPQSDVVRSPGHYDTRARSTSPLFARSSPP